MIKLIGIHGKKRSGKDTAARILQPLTGFDKIDSFAAPLRKFGFDTFGITEENREQNIQAIGVTGRKVLQLVGTEIGRVISPNFWIESLKYRNPDMTGVIITDVRFDNEAEFIKDNGGLIMQVIRPSIMNTIDTHSSEIPIHEKYVDKLIYNDSTEEVYELKITEWFNSITK